MRAKCPKCQQVVEYAAEQAGQPVRCSHCQQAFRAPAAKATPAAPAPQVARPAAARPAAAAPPPPMPVMQSAPAPAPTNSAFDFNVQTAASAGAAPSFVSVSKPTSKIKAKRKSNGMLLGLIIGVPVALIVMCAGIGYLGVQAAAQQAAELQELQSKAREVAHAEAAKKLKSEGELWPSFYLVIPGENGRFKVQGVINEMVDSKLAAQHKYNADVSRNEKTGKWVCHSITIEPVKVEMVK